MWFKAKKEWGRFQPLKYCNECCRLQQPLIYDFIDENCPDCGSKDIRVVIARWESSYGYFSGGTIFYRHEIKE